MNHQDMRLLGQEFYAEETESVARLLLGKILLRVTGSSILTARIVETEAYTEDDPASHSHRGPTPRNQVMFGPPGYAYVYFIYGMYYCLNVATERAGTGAAVLIRAAEPLTGLEEMRRNRRLPASRNSTRDFTGGPGKLCGALIITRADNGLALFDPESPLQLYDAPDQEEIRPVTTGTRIGVKAGNDRLRRYFFYDSPAISRTARKNAV